MDTQLRTKKAKKNIIAMFLIRGISISISFLYVPLLLNTLEKNEYGIWLTLTSIVAWINMFDIGLGNGVRNKLGEALANNDLSTGQKLISTAYGCIFLLAIFLLCLFYIINPFISWSEILNAPKTLDYILNPLAIIVVSSFCLQFALNLITSVLFALQLPALSSMTLMIGQLISFIIVYIEVNFLGIKSLLVLGTTISLIPILTLSLITIYIFVNRYPELRPRISMFRKQYIHSIFSLGLQFFLLQIISIVLFQANNLIIAHSVGSGDVVVYNISYKLMSVIILVFSIIVTPMWSASTDAYAKGDYVWLKMINRKLTRIIILLGFGGIIILILSPWVYKIWIGEREVQIPFLTSGLLLVQSFFQLLYLKCSYMLNGMSKLRVQMILTSALALIYVPTALYFGDYFGLNGVLVVFAFNSIFNSVWANWQLHLLVNQKANGIWAK